LLLSIIIPTQNRVDKLTRLLDSIEKSSLAAGERETIVVMDNCSDGTFEELTKRSDIAQLIETPRAKPNRLYGSTGARTLGAQMAKAPYLCFIDDDNIIDVDMLSGLVKVLQQNEMIGAVGPLMYKWPVGTGVWCFGSDVVKSGRSNMRTSLPVGSDRWISDSLASCDLIPNVFCTRRSTLEEVPFDPVLFPHHWSEADWGFRLQNAGYGVAVTTGAKDWHDCGYRGWTTRLSNPAVVRVQASSRIILRRKYRERFWPETLFWLFWFPLSSAYYSARFVTSGQFRKLFTAYFQGSADGWRQARKL
jgi:GT2 family glycosyltransferase